MNQLPGKSLPQVPTGHELAVLAGKRRIIDLKGHTQRGFINLERWKRINTRWVTQCVGNTQTINPGKGDDITRTGGIEFNSIETIETQNLQNSFFAD